MPARRPRSHKTSRRQLRFQIVGSGAGLALINGHALGDLKHLKPTIAENPRASYPGRNWERVSRDLSRRDSRFTFPLRSQ